jgi:hypothetical protein
MTNSWMRLTIVSKFIAQQLGYKLYLQHAILFSYCIGFCFLLIETVLDGKSKNIKTDDDGKKRIKCQETPSETPLEPGASSAIKTNVPEDDKFLDEPKPWPFN